MPRVLTTMVNTMTSIPYVPMPFSYLRLFGSVSAEEGWVRAVSRSLVALLMSLVALVLVGRHGDGGEH